MNIEIIPENTRLPRDMRNYRDKIDSDPPVAQEVRDIVRGRGASIPPNGPASDLKPFAVYRVLAHHQDSSNRKKPERLGGGLDGARPGHLGPNWPKPDQPGPGQAKQVVWDHPTTGERIVIEVRSDGAVVHEDAAGKDLPGVHHYMHAIFDDILYELRDLLEAINQALECYADNNSAGNARGYQSAVKDFEDFQWNLQPGGSSPYAGAFNSVTLSPVVTHEGFIVSCRVKLNWKNPYHSSSTIKIP